METTYFFKALLVALFADFLAGFRIRRAYDLAVNAQARNAAVGKNVEAQMRHRLDEIESSVNDINAPLAYADQVFVLREHVGLVRRRLDSGHRDQPSPGAAGATDQPPA